MVGIVTFHRQYNYGSALQAYAIQRTIEKTGYTSKILNYYYDRDMAHYGIRWRAGIKVAVFDLLTFPLAYKRKQSYQLFTNRYFDMTEETRSLAGVKKLTQDFDALVCGSDQIWNMGIVDGVNPIYFLTFAQNGQKKISYAPSIAVKGAIQGHREQLREALADFHAISIREDSFVDELKRITDKNISCVLDPTLLLDAKEYDYLISDYKLTLPRKFIFLYCLHHANLATLSKAAEKMAKEEDAQIVYFNKYPILKRPYAKNIFSEDPRAFILTIKKASYVLSDSFHAGIFSVIYKTQFATKVMEDSRSRMDDFFAKFRISYRYINDDFSSLPDVNYEDVYKYWELEKRNSMKFLIDALGDELPQSR